MTHFYPLLNARGVRSRSAMQFSLRGLLLSMAVVGLGLVWFRWPWVEREIFTDPLGYSEVRTQSFRRDWNGRRIKHGLSKFGRYEEFYVDGVLVWEARYSGTGELQYKQHFANGKPHGPFVDRTTGVKGQYRNGQKEGRWVRTEVHGGVTVKCEQMFAAGVPQGTWVWTAGPRYLQSATFEKGRLTRWNGRPVAEEVDRVLTEKRVDPITRDVLATRVEHVDFSRWVSHGGAIFEWPLQTSYHKLVLQIPCCPLDRDCFRDPARPVVEAIVERALLASLTLDYRFGVVCLVPIGESGSDWQRRSGIATVRFEPGSREERAWLEPVGDIPRAASLNEQLTQLFAGTPIQIEVPGRQPPPPLPTQSNSPREPATFCRSRRDLLGLYLLAHGWTCEQKGNRLEIHPAQPAS
jgi:hypothetical protein